MNMTLPKGFGATSAPVEEKPMTDGEKESSEYDEAISDMIDGPQ